MCGVSNVVVVMDEGTSSTVVDKEASLHGFGPEDKGTQSKGPKWDACPVWLRMTDTSTIRPLGLIRQLDVILGGSHFSDINNSASFGCSWSISTLARLTTVKNG